MNHTIFPNNYVTLPEGLAAIVAVVLAIGVTNLSKKNAIIKKLSAVETLGN